MIDWMLYAALVAGLVAGGALALERLVGTSGRPRRFVWLAALALAVAIPATGGDRQRGASAVPEPTLAEPPAIGDAPARNHWIVIPPLPVPEGAQPARIAVLIWGASSLACMTALGGVLVAVTRRRRRWERRRVDGSPVYVSRRFGPALVGVAKPSVVVPAWVVALEPPERAAIIRHEAEHARARDHLTLLCGSLVAAAFPWSPAIWWMYRRLRAAVEMDCDQRVIAGGIGAANYGAVLLQAGSRFHTRWGFVPAMGQPTSLLERRLKTMSEKRRKLAVGHAVALVGVAIGALVVACDAPAPTELREAIEEVVGNEGGEGTDAGLANQPGESTLAKWFDSDAAPLVFVDEVRIDTREDLPEAVRKWVEGGLRDTDLVARVEVVKGTQIYGGGEEAANGAIFILTGQDGPDIGPRVLPAQRASVPMPLVFVDGQRMPAPEIPSNLTPYQFGQAFMEFMEAAFFQDLASLDIEGLEIIKGEAARALYGEEASGGAIQIVTKDPGSSRESPGGSDE